MVPDIYTREKLVLEHRHTLQREAEHERMLTGLPTASSSSIRLLTGRLGMVLIALGMRLQQIVQQFAHMLRTRTGEKLDDWLERVASSPLTDLHPFVAGVYQDKAAVQAGLTLPWSQGQTEGQITRLKLIKRQGYGRAKFDLLRQRVLHAA